MIANLQLPDSLTAETADGLPEDLPVRRENVEENADGAALLTGMLMGQKNSSNPPPNNLFVFAAKESAEEKEDERCSTEWQRDNFNRTLVNSKGKQKNTRSYQLEYSWTFWITDPSKSWNEAIEQVYEFSTARNFWRLFNHLIPPSHHCHYSYNLFKRGIKPEWEDPMNAAGGRWNITSGLSGNFADMVWLELCMLCVGGQELDSLSAFINGIYLVWKRDVARVSVWMNTMDRDHVKAVGKVIQKELQNHMKRKYSLEFTECKPSRGKKAFLYSLD